MSESFKNSYEPPVSESKEEQCRDTVISRVFSKNPQEEGEIIEVFKKVFASPEFYQAERVKTHEELEIIAAINEKLKGFIENYGGTYVTLSPDLVHMIDPQKLSKSDWRMLKEWQGENMSDGWTLLTDQGIFINLYRHDDLVHFANVLAHEQIHHQQFVSVHAQWADDQEDVLEFWERRYGMKIFSTRGEEGTTQYLHWLNEAVTEELNRRFVGQLTEIPAMKKGLDERARNFPDMDVIERISSTHIRTWKSHEKVHVEFGPHSAYGEERSMLNDLIDQIYEKNKEKFTSREDVFHVFSNASLTGRLLPVARLIEGTMGKGYVRKMAEHQKEVFLPECTVHKLYRAKGSRTTGDGTPIEFSTFEDPK